EALRLLQTRLAPALRLVPARTDSLAALRRALNEVIDSLERFNRRWVQFVEELELTAINELRAGYNRYYVLEKEFALRSARVARHGFVPLAPITSAMLLELMPVLPVPIVAHGRP